MRFHAFSQNIDQVHSKLEGSNSCVPGVSSAEGGGDDSASATYAACTIAVALKLKDAINYVIH